MGILDEKYTLADGTDIPRIGLGTWLMDDAEAAGAVRDAVACGYRMIDTAQAYGNETGVGEGVRTCGVPRDQLFIGSKVAAELKDYESARVSIDETLQKMGLDYLDQMIVHSPQPWVEVNQSDDRHEAGNLEAWRSPTRWWPRSPLATASRPRSSACVTALSWGFSPCPRRQMPPTWPTTPTWTLPSPPRTWRS